MPGLCWRVGAIAEVLKGHTGVLVEMRAKARSDGQEDGGGPAQPGAGMLASLASRCCGEAQIEQGSSFEELDPSRLDRGGDYIAFVTEKEAWGEAENQGEVRLEEKVRGVERGGRDPGGREQP